MSTLLVYRGDSLPLTATVTYTVTGLPVDLTGGTLRFTVKTAAYAPDSQALAILTSPSRIAISTPTMGGPATWTLAAADLPALALPLYNTMILVWDLQFTDASGNVQTVDSGQLQVTPDVSITSP